MPPRDETTRQMLGAYLGLALALALAMWLVLGAVGTMREGMVPSPPPTVLGTVHTAPTYEPMTPATAPGAVAVPYKP